MNGETSLEVFSDLLDFGHTVLVFTSAFATYWPSHSFSPLPMLHFLPMIINPLVTCCVLQDLYRIIFSLPGTFSHFPFHFPYGLILLIKDSGQCNLLQKIHSFLRLCLFSDLSCVPLSSFYLFPYSSMSILKLVT